MTNLDNILTRRDITLPTKVCLVKAMVFPVLLYECESWTIKKAVCECASCSVVVSNSLQPQGLSLPGSSALGILQARMRCHSLLQGIFLTQGSNLILLHCRPILYRLSHQGRMLSAEELMLLNCGIGEDS